MKQKRAVLYELMRDHRGAGANGVSGGRLRDSQPSHSYDVVEAPPVLAPSRTLGIPLGYVFLGIAAVLVIGLAAYLIGHSRGRDNEALGATNDSVEDPALAGGVDVPISGAQRSASQAESSGPAEPPTRRPGPIESNPRTVGMNYFVLVQTSRTNAMRVAEFCRQHGLEAYVDRVNNADFRVFVLPGYTAEEMSSPAVAELEQRIEEIKTAWNDSVGRSDLGQHIAVKYRG